MESFLQNKMAIFRGVAVLSIIVAIVVMFWVNPKDEGLSENEKAAMRVARMEGQSKETSATKSGYGERGGSAFSQQMKNKQEKQIQYAMILLVVLALVFLLYSFLSKKNKE